MAERTIKIEIKRQKDEKSSATWEKFEIPYRPNMNVTSALMEIAANPVNAEGTATSPITYDSNCLEEICGSCTMVINGKARMACSALIDKFEQPLKLEPLTKFPVVRDLMVDRSVLFENLKRVQAWVPIDGTYNLGEGPRQSPQLQEELYPLSRCISCCICMEVCPQFNVSTGFVGAASIAQAKLFNENPTGKVLKEDRLRALMGEGGIQDCSYAQNCVNACPKEVPLTRAISDVNRDALLQGVKDFFTR
jgi:succinate dehydrogenase / fumarate reductase iron-sulfur subunit